MIRFFTVLTLFLGYVAAIDPIDPTKYFYLVASTQKARAANSHNLTDARPIHIQIEEDHLLDGYHPMTCGTDYSYAGRPRPRFKIIGGLLKSPDCGEQPGGEPVSYGPCNSTGATKGHPLTFYDGYEGPQNPPPETLWSIVDGYLLAWDGQAHKFLTVDITNPNDEEGDAVYYGNTSGYKTYCLREYGREECDQKLVYLHAYRKSFDTQ